MRAIAIALGTSYGSLTVLNGIGLVKGRSTYMCRCACGKEMLVSSGELHRKARLGGACRECGSVVSGKKSIKHGDTTNGLIAPEYRSWCAMLSRCLRPTDQAFARYGGSGISVCARWMEYGNFLADMGRRPSLEHSIDRYPDGDGNYEPSNCRWATRKEQTENRRNTRRITINGEVLTCAEWARRSGFSIWNAYRIAKRATLAEAE